MKKGTVYISMHVIFYIPKSNLELSVFCYYSEDKNFKQLGNTYQDYLLLNLYSANFFHIVIMYKACYSRFVRLFCIFYISPHRCMNCKIRGA